MVEHNFVGQRNNINGKSLLWILHPYLPGMWEVIASTVPEPKCVVELGTNVGRWCKEMLARFPSIEKLYALDAWYNDEQFEGWKENVVDPRAIPLKGFTNDKSLFSQVGESIDVLYVDACHQYAYAFGDLLLWSKKVRTGGLILVDDFNERGVRRAVNDFLLKKNRVGKGKSDRFGGDLENKNTQWWIVKDW